MTTEGRGGFQAEGNSPNSSVSIGARRKWALTQEAFDDLLATLDGDRERAAEKYVELRANLVSFFEWRGGSSPDDHADETLNRVAKRIRAGEEIRNPAAYALGVARLLLLEIIKERAREQVALKESAHVSENIEDPAGSADRLDCLRDCLNRLPPDNRELIVQYYQGEKGGKIQNRKKLVERLGIPVNTLRMRALRLREKLQVCVEDCMVK